MGKDHFQGARARAGSASTVKKKKKQGIGLMTTRRGQGRGQAPSPIGAASRPRLLTDAAAHQVWRADEGPIKSAQRPKKMGGRGELCDKAK